MSQQEIIVVGGANIDVKARPSRVMKSATSNPGAITISAGGVARNIAHNLALIECRPALVTMLGNDDQGDRLFRETAAAGVDMAMTARVDQPTGIYCAVLDLEGELAIAVNSMDIIEALTPAILSAHASRIRKARYIVADCNVSLETLGWLAGFANDTGRRLIMEAVSVPKTVKIRQLLEQGHALYAATPNMLQAEALTGVRIARASDAFEAAKKIAAMGVELVVITLGDQGVYVHSSEGSAHVPPFEAEGPADVTGAGDAMTAGLICGLVQGMPAVNAAHLGQAAACITIASSESVARNLSRRALLEMAGSRIGVNVS